ncbi:hypothetical protein FRC12_006522 [Ceratobasidium sp. 428]|nr:hypothetical protein FRC12_006522 [Ceratobasidium sp. 428]
MRDPSFVLPPPPTHPHFVFKTTSRSYNMSEASAPAQKRESTLCVGPATPSHERVVSGIEIMLCTPEKPALQYTFRRDEHKVLLVGHDPNDNRVMRAFCGDQDLLPSNIVKHAQFMWTDNKLRVINLSSRNVVPFEGAPRSLRNLERGTVHLIVRDVIIFFDQCDSHLDWATIKFKYSEGQEEAENMEAKSGFSRSQLTTPPIAPPVSMGSSYSGPSYQDSLQDRYLECVELTTTEDDESEDEEADSLGVVHGRDRLMGASGGEEGSIMNQPSTVQEKEHKCTESGQGVQSSARSWTSVFPDIQASLPMERSHITSLGLMALGAAAMWGVLAVELI